MRHFVIACCLLFTVVSCSDPAENQAEDAAAQGNISDSSSSNQEFNKDTTIEMNSGGNAGTPVAPDTSALK
jgi:hypothetical protein